MGFYNDGNIYGVKWIVYDKDENYIKEWEKTFPHKINLEQIEIIKEVYDSLTEEEQKNCSIFFYTCCSDTYTEGSYMSWISSNKKSLAEFFEKGDTII